MTVFPGGSSDPRALRALPQLRRQRASLVVRCLRFLGKLLRAVLLGTAVGPAAPPPPPPPPEPQTTEQEAEAQR